MGVLRWLALERASDDALLARVKAHPLLADASYRSSAGGALDEALGRDLEALAELDAAEPLLIRIVEEHVDPAVRAAAMRALSARSTPRAREVLARQAQPFGRIRRHGGLLPHEVEDHARRAREEGDTASRELAVRVLHHLVTDRAAELGAWLPLAAALRGDDDIGEAARVLLRAGPRDEALRLVAEIAGAKARPPVVEEGPRTPWDVLAAKSALTTEERAYAERLCREIMEKVARNADRVTERLERLGWSLADEPRRLPSVLAVPRTNPFTGERLVPPASVGAQIADVASRVGGTVPLALATFWRVVGGIDWAPREGPLPPWAQRRDIDLDPLVVDPSLEAHFALREWEEDLRRFGGIELAGPFAWPFAPDRFHKVQVSGGGAYELLLPSTDLDPVVRNAPEKLRFVPYLRNAFRWGGLPGLAYVERSAELDAVIAELTEGLEPF